MALTPTSSGLGYHYRDRHGIIKTIGKKEMQQELKPTALTFTKPLPLRALNIKDLISFAWSVVSGPNTLMLCLAALVVVLLARNAVFTAVGPQINIPASRERH